MTIRILACLAMVLASSANGDLQQLPYNNPGLVVDLGVGLWAQPLPMDYDGDGDHDLVAASADVPSNGVYFFENTAGDVLYPVFKPGVRLCAAEHNTTISYVGGQSLVQTPGKAFPDFLNSQFEKGEEIPFKTDLYMGRAKQWKRFDYDGDGATDLILGVSDWREYGWDNAYTDAGEWTNGPIHGHVYWVRNLGSDADPRYGDLVQVQAGGAALDVYGCPSPNFADWDGDGDCDLICGEFLDQFTYFENIGSRKEPQYAVGRRLTHEGRPIAMDLQMLQVVAFDWDKDGDADLVVGQEDGRVALMECTGRLEAGLPEFLPPRFFQQEAAHLKVGALSTPFAVDWDGDGDQDLICGDTAGYVNFVENLDGGALPKWAAPVYLKAGNDVIRIQAGPNGSIQGPAEAKWGYTVLNAADWDMDGAPDIVINSIWGKVMWYRNSGGGQLEAAQPVDVDWEGTTPKPAWTWWQPEGKQLVTQWRTTPVIIDLNKDGLNDLVMLDTEGYLAFFERKREGDGLILLPGKRTFENEDGSPLRLNDKEAGKSGRRKLALVDWDLDGKLDILANGLNADFLRNVAAVPGKFMFRNEGPVDKRKLAGHTTCPTIVDWDANGVPDLLLGAEDGFFYYLRNPKS